MARTALMVALAVCAAVTACGGGDDRVAAETRSGCPRPMKTDGISLGDWSSGGKLVLASRSRVFVLDRHTCEVSDVAAGDEASWSPDGQRLVISRFAGRGFHLFVLEIDDSEAKQITFDVEGGLQDSAPTWSPSGELIAFIHRSEYDDLGLVLVRPDGIRAGGRLYPREGFSEQRPAWSPDSRWIAWIPCGYPGPQKGLCLVRPDGVVARRFLGWTATLALESLRRLSDPSWSPDGRFLAFADASAGAARIMIQSTRGGRARPLFDRGAPDKDSQPEWSRDGRWLAFVRRGTDVYVVRPDGSGLRQLTKATQG